MNSSVTELEDNKVKLLVTVDESEFEKELDAAFVRIGKEVNLPGFRPGKVPRKILEARLGVAYAREDAMREAIPQYYSDAVAEHDVDVIDQPEIDITDGQESGPVVFEATVMVRPRIVVAGYQNLRVEIPSPDVSDEELDEYVERLREQNADLELVDRPAETDDHVTVDINGEHNGEPVPGLTASDYDYRIGLGAVVPELDENLVGASAGDTVEFAAEHPDPEEEGTLDFVIHVKEVKATVLPDLTDEFIADVSEFETIEAMRVDLTERFGAQKKMQAQMAIRDETAKALANLVEEEAPEPLVASEMQSRVQDMAMRLQQQGMQLEQYLQMSGTTPDAFTADLKDMATESVKVDLALRHVVEAENTVVDEAEFDAEIEGLAVQIGEPADVIRERLAQAGQLEAVRSDLQKRNALEWLIEQVEVVDPDGKTINREDLELPEEPDSTENPVPTENLDSPESDEDS